MVSEAVVSPAFGVPTKLAKDGPRQAIKMQADELSREVVRYKKNPSTANYSIVNTTSSTLGTAQSSPFAHAKYLAEVNHRFL